MASRFALRLAGLATAMSISVTFARLTDLSLWVYVCAGLAVGYAAAALTRCVERRLSPKGEA